MNNCDSELVTHSADRPTASLPNRRASSAATNRPFNVSNFEGNISGAEVVTETPHEELMHSQPSCKVYDFFSLDSLGRRKRNKREVRRSDSVKPEMITRRPTLKRSLTTKTELLKDHISIGTAIFFGLPNDVDACMQKWANRRMRHCSRRYGAVREPPQQYDLCTVDSSACRRETAPSTITESKVTNRAYDLARSLSVDGSRTSDDPLKRLAQNVFRRDSVAKMAWDGLSSMIRSPSRPRQSLRSKSSDHRDEFSPAEFFGPTAPVSLHLRSIDEKGVPEKLPINTTTATVTKPYVSIASRRFFGTSMPPLNVRTGIIREMHRSVAKSQVKDDLASIEMAKKSTRPVTEARFCETHQIQQRVHLSTDRWRPVDEALAQMSTIKEQLGESQSFSAQPKNDLVIGKKFKSATVPHTERRRRRRLSLETASSKNRDIVMRQSSTEISSPISLQDEVFIDLVPMTLSTPLTIAKPDASKGDEVPVVHTQQHRSVRGGQQRKAVIVFVAQNMVVRRKSSESRPKSELYSQLASVDEEDGPKGLADVDVKFFVKPSVAPLGSNVAETNEKFSPSTSLFHRRNQIISGLDSDDLCVHQAVEYPTTVPYLLDGRTSTAAVPAWTTSAFGRMCNKMLFRAINRHSKRRFGEGVWGRFFGRKLRKSHELGAKVQEQLDDFDDYRPYFTCRMMTVHVLIMIISLATYGLGPFGFSRRQYSAMVLQTSLVLEQVAYFEKENFWIGPRFADLVHLGAKYAPCMRKDKNIQAEIDKIKRLEKESACCIRNDNTGCVQTTKYNCPICTETVESPKLPHTKCELTGRPCCIGISGECRITTREYCDFVKGYFHEEATLCSQVSCLSDICGMILFVDPKNPDQFYRLFTSIFIHAGLLHCLLTLVVQYYLMRDLEKLIGWLRLSIVYLCSGVAGNLASAVFSPYEPEVGPAGSHFGILAALLTDALYSWPMILRPYRALCQLLAVLGFLLILGLLPWVDNWAHAFGFLFGLLLSLVLFPYIQFKKNDFKRRLVIITVCMSTAVAIFAALLSMFYFNPLWKCNFCVYFNCIPLTEHFCDNEGLSLQPLPF